MKAAYAAPANGGRRKAARGQPAPSLNTLALAIEAGLLSEDLGAFAKACWHVLEPTAVLRWGWALDAICQHLMAVTEGKITRLLINVPPGCMKSLLTGVIWPAWEWTRKELRSYRYLGTAHKQELSVRDNMKCRRLIQSAWYQKRWPLKLLGDQNAKTKFENEDTGFREAMAFTSMTGSRGDRVLLDDPLSVDQANSEADLKAAETTFLESLPTRVNNEQSAIVVIMQRLCDGDTSGLIIEKKLGYVHLMLPMRFDPGRRCETIIGFKDPRTEDGELLFPERFSENTVVNLEIVLGEYATAGQLQQAPAPRGGGVFKLHFIQYWPADMPLPDFEYVVQSYDTAFTEKTVNDPTACTVWGVFRRPKDRLYAIMLLEAWDEHLSYPKLRRRVLKDWTAEYGGTDNDMLHPPRRADAVLIENKGSGQSLIQDLNAAGVPAQQYNPGKADKYSRAQQILPMYEQKLVYVLSSKVYPGKAITWAQKFITLLSKFTAVTVSKDDYVDTLTQVMRFLRDIKFLALPMVPVEEEKEHDYAADSKKRRNPYD